MRATRVGCALDGVELEVDAQLGTDRQQLSLAIGEGVGPTETFHEVLAAVAALDRHRRIQFERQPEHLGRTLAARSERLLQTRMPDVAPRADDIREHLDPHGRRAYT